MQIQPDLHEMGFQIAMSELQTNSTVRLILTAWTFYIVLQGLYVCLTDHLASSCCQSTEVWSASKLQTQQKQVGSNKLCLQHTTDVVPDNVGRLHADTCAVGKSLQAAKWESDIRCSNRMANCRNRMAELCTLTNSS